MFPGFADRAFLFNSVSVESCAKAKPVILRKIQSVSTLIVAFLIFLTSLISINGRAQNFINWIGGTSTDYFNVNNWSDPTINFAVMNNNNLHQSLEA